MKLLATSLALLTTTLALAALAPTAKAIDPYCVAGEPDCPAGELACVFLYNPACVPDPCDDTRCVAFTAASDPCWRQSAGYYTSVTCVHPTRPDCLVERWEYVATDTFHSCWGVPAP